MPKKKFFIFCLIFCLAACAFISNKNDQKTIEEIALSHAWKKEVIHTKSFDLISFHSNSLKENLNLIIYIEGDGRAWKNDLFPPKDPTPLNPMFFNLALSDYRANIIYLARPCQFNIQDNHCSEKYWTSHRFSPEVVESTNEAIDFFKKKLHAKKINLIGYSGGAAVALLTASLRKDTESIITIGGNLDHKAWTQRDRLSPLSGSLNAIDFIEQLKNIPQYHFVGSDDKVTGPDLIKSYVNKTARPSLVKYFVIPEFSHVCCWEKIWHKIIANEIND